MELEVLGDRYELQEPIGRGGMATIYRAVDLRMGRTVAVKILREVYSSDPKFVTRFQREARAASALQHPNIVQVFDYGQSNDSYYIVMEFVDGTDLRRYLKKQGMLDNERAVEIAHDVALGLGAAHKRGIVHRDVKPQNIMLNDVGLVKLTDFGIASMYKDVEAERLTTTGMTLGTVQYYAPEQAQGEIVSPSADIYALGIVMYEMLAGRTPFDGDTPVAVAMRHIQDIPEPPSVYNPRISPALERIILRCLEKNPRERYRDGDALAYALENFLRAPGRRPVTTGGPGVRPQFGPLGLPATDGRAARGANPAYGGPAVASGPRGGRPPSQPLGGRVSGPFGGMPDVPPQDAFDRFGPPDEGISTSPFGPAASTLPRSPTLGHVSGPYGAPQRPGPAPRGSGAITAAVVSAAVLLLVLACVLVLSLTNAGSAFGQIFSSPTPTATQVMAAVPDFTHQQFTDAQALAESDHLKVSATYVANAAAKGLVLDQSVQAGQSVPWNTNIVLTVSNGPDKIKVPDVSNLLLSDALNKLNDANLTNVTIIADPNSTVPAGYAIKTVPAAGTPVLPTDKIQLYYSQPVPTATALPSPSPTATATTTCTPGTVTPASC